MERPADVLEKEEERRSQSALGLGRSGDAELLTRRINHSVIQERRRQQSGTSENAGFFEWRVSDEETLVQESGEDKENT